MKEVTIIRGASDILGDRLDIEEYSDTYTVIEEMSTYCHVKNNRTDATYFFKNDYIKEK